MAGAVLFDEKSLKVLLSSQLFRGTPNRPSNMKCMVCTFGETGQKEDSFSTYNPPSQLSRIRGLEHFALKGLQL
jgi:hypothetical protein